MLVYTYIYPYTIIYKCQGVYGPVSIQKQLDFNALKF